MERAIPFFGHVAPIMDEFDAGQAHFTVEWMVADTDLEVAAGNAATSTLEEVFRDVESGRVRLAGALVSVEGKPWPQDLATAVGYARKWPDVLYQSLQVSYWRAYSQFRIEKETLDAQPGESVPGTDASGGDSAIPGISGNAP